MNKKNISSSDRLDWTWLSSIGTTSLSYPHRQTSWYHMSSFGRLFLFFPCWSETGSVSGMLFLHTAWTSSVTALRGLCLWIPAETWEKIYTYTCTQPLTSCPPTERKKKGCRFLKRWHLPHTCHNTWVKFLCWHCSRLIEKASEYCCHSLLRSVANASCGPGLSLARVCNEQFSNQIPNINYGQGFYFRDIWCDFYDL